MGGLRWPVALVGLISAWLYCNAYLNHFYEFGASADSLWYLGLLWQGDWTLPNPPGIDGRSYFTVHSMPMLIPFTLLSHFLPFGPIEWLAIVFGLLHGFVNGTAAWGFARAGQLLGVRPALAGALATAMGLALALSPVQAQFVSMPHPEIIIPGLLTAFLMALAVGRTRVAGLLFVLLLMTREDAGLHAALFLAGPIWMLRRQTGRWPTAETNYAIAGIAVTFLLILILGSLPEAQNMGMRNYIGEPAFAHVTGEAVASHLQYFGMQSAHLWAPLLLMLLAACWQRSLWLACGALAVVPWLLFNLVLGQPVPTWLLAYYYVFPVLAALLWPSICILYATGPSAARRATVSKGLLGLQILVLALSYLPTFSSSMPWNLQRYADVRYTLSEEAGNRAAYAAFTRALLYGHDELGRLVGNYAVLAMAPRTLGYEELIEPYVNRPRAERPALDSVVFFERPYTCNAVSAAWLENDLPFRYEVVGTRLVLLTRKRLDELPSFAPLLSPLSPSVRPCERPSLHQRLP